MQYIHTHKPDTGITTVADKIVSALRVHTHVLWLIAGGSNIPIAVEIEEKVLNLSTKEQLKHLSVSQTDERYGPVGHKDSNWQQMIEAGFDFEPITFIHILRNLPLQETVKAFALDIEPVFDVTPMIIGQFGIGVDGHIAGILPHSPAVTDEALVSGYESEPFTRISLSPRMIERITVAYLFAFGESKKEALSNLKNRDLSLADEPAQILKRLKEVYVYSDEV